jgi:serine/threonine protein kinase
MKMGKAIFLLIILTAGIGAFYLKGYMDRSVVELKNGAVITADKTWESDGLIYYKIENEVDLFKKVEVERFGKPELETLLRHSKFELAPFFAKTNTEFKSFAKDTSDSISQNIVWVIGIISVTTFCIIVLLVVHLIMRLRLTQDDAAQHREPAGLKATSSGSSGEAKEGITRLDIVNYFRMLFKLQIGADPQAPMSVISLPATSSGSNNYVYELRIKHRGDWVRRRMTIGPIGEETGSKSKCYYVIYDVHLVVKIPAKPITEFEDYIESIKKEGWIVDKLAPKKCIVPRVSTVLNLINILTESSPLSADKLEEKYVHFLRENTDYQNYLKIKNSFVFFMDFSKYYFLGHIVDNLHDVKDAIAEEMFENAETIFDNQKFRGRYGKAKESIGLEIRQVYDHCQAAIRQFLTDSGISSNVSMFRIQTWFLTHLGGRAVAGNEAGLSENLVHELNLVIELNFTKRMDAVEACRSTIMEYVHKIWFEQNKPQMSGIITNLLDLLAWLRTKRIAMRDLKPDNLFVAGDPSKYPLFLINADEYELGIIDVETAVDFEKTKYRKVKQPLLGGTPFYATPSHFFSNRILSEAFHNLNLILHLQDWYATLVMVFKTVTGELMFEHTAKLFADIRNTIKFGQLDGKPDTEIVADVSRVFWRRALLEFQNKMGQKENALKSIVFDIPQDAKQMFKTVLVKDIQATTEKIKQCVNMNSQKFFESPQSQELLLKASPDKINQLRAEFENKVRSLSNSSANHTRAIPFLKYLRTLKLHLDQQKQLLKRLGQTNSKLSAYTLLGFMFNNLYKSMFREKWWVKTVAEQNFSDADVNEATLEATVPN